MVAEEREREMFIHRSLSKSRCHLLREIQPSPTFADFYRNICDNIHVDNCSSDNVYHPHNCLCPRFVGQVRFPPRKKLSNGAGTPPNVQIGVANCISAARRLTRGVEVLVEMIDATT